MVRDGIGRRGSLGLNGERGDWNKRGSLAMVQTRGDCKARIDWPW